MLNASIDSYFLISNSCKDENGTQYVKIIRSSEYLDGLKDIFTCKIESVDKNLPFHEQYQIFFGPNDDDDYYLILRPTNKKCTFKLKLKITKELRGAIIIIPSY